MSPCWAFREAEGVDFAVEKDNWKEHIQNKTKKWQRSAVKKATEEGGQMLRKEKWY